MGAARGARGARWRALTTVGGRARAQVHNASFSAFIEGFTTNTYLMVITSDPSIQPAMTLTNLHAARAVFEETLANLSDPANEAAPPLAESEAAAY